MTKSPNTYEFPGFIDVHVHFRDPGMPAAETTQSGASAARHGGFGAVVTMPNTTPAGDSVEWVRTQLYDTSLPVKIIPSACITRGRLGREVAQLEALADAGAAFFTDDGAYVADAKVMEEAMRRAKALDMCICEHAMDLSIQKRGVMRDCEFARRLCLPVIPVEAETAAIKRDISLCRETGCRLHIQHISTAEGVELVRYAQKEGLRVTAEATPHHLLLSCEEITADDANWKMAPPLGNHEDRAELRRAVKDGVLMFATDHAPHPPQAKDIGFLRSANGIIGLETAIPITYYVMVEQEKMGIKDWARAWYDMPLGIIRDGPERLARIPHTKIEIGKPRKVKSKFFRSLSRNMPYEDMEFSCWPV